MNLNGNKNGQRQGLYELLRKYAESDYYPCHMPGHKRNPQAGEMADFCHIDITEIDGFDNLHEPEGILHEAQQRAGWLYGCEETFYLVNGSTAGVQAAILTATKPGEELLISRGCHKSVYHSAILQGLALHYLPTHRIEEYDICDAPRVEDVERMLEEHPQVRAVIITSPTYEGILADVSAIAALVHRKNKILIVDEAHGAHLKPELCLTGTCAALLDGEQPQDAISAGADLVIHSLHKTLPSMTQTALLHVKGERVDRLRLRKYLAMLQSSSPSYVLMASMDSCIAYLENQGAEDFLRLKERYAVFCEQTKACRHIRIGSLSQVQGKGYGLAGWDIGKLVISVKDTEMSGQELYDTLRERYHLQMEMAADTYVLAMMTILDTAEGWKRLADALTEIDAKIKQRDGREQRTEIRLYGGELPEVLRTPAEAFHAKKEQTALEDAVGRIAGDFVNLYPPGIPFLVPGERIDVALVEKVRSCLSMGLHVQGVTREGKIWVVAP